MARITRLGWTAILPAFALLLPVPVPASDGASPEARWNAVVACASRSDERQRHACIDDVLRQAGALTAEQNRRDERQRFGRAGEPPVAQEPDAIEVTIRTAIEGRDGRWSFTTEDGAVWRQTETRSFAVTPAAGQRLTLKKGMLGSFLCLIDGRFPFRCARSRRDPS